MNLSARGPGEAPILGGSIAALLKELPRSKSVCRVAEIVGDLIGIRYIETIDTSQPKHIAYQRSIHEACINMGQGIGCVGRRECVRYLQRCSS